MWGRLKRPAGFWYKQPYGKRITVLNIVLFISILHSLLDMDKPTPGVVEADHIPPKSSLNELCMSFRRNPEMANSLKTNNEAAYELVMSMSNDQNGRKQLCMNTLYSDHRRALTSGNSSESRACRSQLFLNYPEPFPSKIEALNIKYL